MTKLIEELAAARPALRVGRLTLDILGAIPGRAGAGSGVGGAAGHAHLADGRRDVAPVARWRRAAGRPRHGVAARAPATPADVATDRYPPLVEGESIAVPHSWEGAPGTWRRSAGAGRHGRPARQPWSWLSPLVPLVDSEQTTDLQRLAMVVDSANGVGAALDPEKFMFMNTDTAVHLHRLPGRQRLRAARPRVDRPRRHRRHHRGDLRPPRVHRHVGADAAGTAPLSGYCSGVISCSIVGTSSLTVGWMCMVREMAV